MFSRIQRTSVSTAASRSYPGKVNFSVMRSPILRRWCGGDEHAAGADVLGQAGVEVVIALEVDLDLEIEPLRGPNVLLVAAATLAPVPVSMLVSLLVDVCKDRAAPRPQTGSTGARINCSAPGPGPQTSDLLVAGLAEVLLAFGGCSRACLGRLGGLGAGLAAASDPRPWPPPCAALGLRLWPAPFALGRVLGLRRPWAPRHRPRA